jgi:hypothetical protein
VAAGVVAVAAAVTVATGVRVADELGVSVARGVAVDVAGAAVCVAVAAAAAVVPVAAAVAAASLSSSPQAASSENATSSNRVTQRLGRRAGVPPRHSRTRARVSRKSGTNGSPVSNVHGSTLSYVQERAGRTVTGDDSPEPGAAAAGRRLVTNK